MQKAVFTSLFLIGFILSSLYVAAMVMAYSDTTAVLTPTAAPTRATHMPDLTVDIQFTPVFSCPSTAAQVTVTIRNNSTSQVGRFTANVNGVEISIAGLEAGDLQYYLVAVTPDVAIEASVDIDNQIAEANEYNNHASTIIPADYLGRQYLYFCTPTWTPPPADYQSPTPIPQNERPDLQARVFYNDSLGECGTSRRIETIEIINAGQTDAGAFVVELSGVETRIDGLAVGESYEISMRQYNTLNLRGQIDVYFEVDEADENNNLIMIAPSTVGAYAEYFVVCTPSPTSPAHPKPDLAAQFIFDEAVCGGTITHVEIINVGQADALATFDVILFGGEEIHDIAGLKSGESVRLPAQFRADKTEIHVQLDSANVVDEFDETNNVTFTQLMTTTRFCTPTPYPASNTPLPDLQITLIVGMSPVCAAVVEGITIENIGEGDAPPFLVQINQQLKFVESGLASGDSVYFPASELITDSTLLTVDPFQQITEENEANNVPYPQIFSGTPIPMHGCTPPPSQ